MRFRHFNWSRFLLVVIDALILNACRYVAYWLRFDGAIPPEYWHLYITTTVWITPLFFAVAMGFGLYNRIWEHASLDAALVIVGTATVTMGLACFLMLAIEHLSCPRSVLAMTWCFLIISVGGSRFAWRFLRERIYPPERESDGPRRRVLIYGAGDSGVMLARQMRDDRQSPYDVVGFVDDNPRLRGMIAGGLKVLGTGDQLASIVRQRDVHEIVAALPTVAGGKLKELLHRGASLGVTVRTIPRLLEMVNGQRPLNRVRDIGIDDLLGRDTGQLTPTDCADYLSGRTVLVTGAGGSIGSEICRQLCRYHPRQIVLLGRGENRIHKVYYELKDKHPRIEFVPVICNITSREALADALAQYRPEVILHAGAHKHVFLMEVNTVEAVRNNVLGTALLAELAEAHGVERFIFVSTDKAVEPTSVMGATKRLCERVLVSRNGGCKTKFMAVRFGNVIGSSGSVLPIFQAHVAAGRPIPVTHPEVDRFFMTIEEAAFLVLQAGSLGQGGDIFVLDMGEPIRILDVARTVLELSGRDPDDPQAIEIIGLRPGEKMHESLTHPWEDLIETECPLVRKL
ncbi:MAG: polysaccharide biosynthesis protein, partial [Armatimonadetes bacterium]|nr:polysaccharide biosynthesis protein [Armatimonadota bacterium]